jgi:hypothetical protein
MTDESLSESFQTRLDAENIRESRISMGLTGNRKVAAICASLLAMAGTAALTIVGVTDDVAMLAITLEAALGGAATVRKDLG